MNRKTAVLVTTVLQLVVFGVLLGWQVTDRHHKGWTGLGYSPEVAAGGESIALLVPYGSQSREIAVVAPRSPAASERNLSGHKVMTVNGVEVSDVNALHRIADSTRAGDTVTYRIEKDERQRDVVLKLESPFRSPYVTANFITSVVVGLSWLGISLLVYWSRPHSNPAAVFFLMSSSGAALYFLWAVSELRVPDLRGVLPMSAEITPLILLGVAVVLSILLANLLLHLSLIFPKRRPIVDRWPTVFRWLHMLPAASLASVLVMTAATWIGRHPMGLSIAAALLAVALSVLAVRLLRAAVDEGWKHAVLSRPGHIVALALLLMAEIGWLIRLAPSPLMPLVFGLVFLAFVIVLAVVWPSLYAILTFISLLRSYRESGVEVRHQVRWPLWGTLSALGFSILVSTTSIALGYGHDEVTTTTFALASAASMASKFAYLLIPIGFAFAILKHRLLDIDVIIRKTVIYSSATGIVLALYLVLAGVSGLVLVRSAGLKGETASVIATLAVVALFVPIRNRVQGFVDRRFFKRERDFEAARREIDDLILAGHGHADVLHAVAEVAQNALHCRSTAIFTRTGDSFRSVASVGLPDRRLRHTAVAIDSAFLDGDATIIDAARLTGAEATTLRPARSSVLAVARRENEVVAMFSAGPKLDGERFDDEDIAFLSTLADQLVLAIGRSDQSRSREELRRAREIQRSLLPDVLPQIDGLWVTARWQPAREVSGDYYDVLALDRHRLALCIGDVVGKGMPAALLMSGLQAAFKAVAVRADSPREVCSQVREVMLQSLSGGTFVTFFFCIVDRRAGRLSYTNAGHNRPILARADGTVIRLDVGGPILARVTADLPYHEATVRIAPGDRLVLFTDGVTEAMDADEEMFEEDRLETLVHDHRGLSAEALEGRITSAVTAHADGILQDDLTLLVAAVE
jgi:serine phosphatase RsbU (regulator of sigma subunit)